MNPKNFIFYYDVYRTTRNNFAFVSLYFNYVLFTGSLLLICCQLQLFKNCSEQCTIICIFCIRVQFIIKCSIFLHAFQFILDKAKKKILNRIGESKKLFLTPSLTKSHYVRCPSTATLYSPPSVFSYIFSIISLTILLTILLRIPIDLIIIYHKTFPHMVSKAFLKSTKW